MWKLLCAKKGVSKESCRETDVSTVLRNIMHYNCFQAATPEFRAYQEQVMSNCKTMANALLQRDYKLVSGQYVIQHT